MNQPSEAEKGQYLTIPEIATMLQVSRETIRRAIRQGKLKAVKFGGNTGSRISRQALQEYLEELSKVPAA